MIRAASEPASACAPPPPSETIAMSTRAIVTTPHAAPSRFAGASTSQPAMSHPGPGRGSHRLTSDHGRMEMRANSNVTTDGSSLEIRKPDEQWRAELTPQQYDILRRRGTEPPFTGEYVCTKRSGSLPLRCMWERAVRLGGQVR